GRAGADVPDRLEPAGTGHRYIHDNDIGRMCLERAVGVGGVVGLGDHFEIVLMLQHAPIALPDHGMVIDEQDRNSPGLRWGHQAASGIMAATRTPRVASAIDSEPPSAVTRSRMPVRPKPVDRATLAASPPPSSSTWTNSAFSAPL